jgi:hypothetical protein
MALFYLLKHGVILRHYSALIFRVCSYLLTSGIEAAKLRHGGIDYI